MAHAGIPDILIPSRFSQLLLGNPDAQLIDVYSPQVPCLPWGNTQLGMPGKPPHQLAQ